MNILFSLTKAIKNAFSVATNCWKQWKEKRQIYKYNGRKLETGKDKEKCVAIMLRN